MIIVIASLVYHNVFSGMVKRNPISEWYCDDCRLSQSR